MGIGRRVEPVDEVVRGVVGVWAWPTAGMPDGGALQEHLLAVAERLAALGAARARRVEVVVVAGLAAAGEEGTSVRFDCMQWKFTSHLENFAGNEPPAVGALDPELPLVVPLAIRPPVLAHVLAVK